MIPKNISILLIEDNPGDVRLTKEAFSESRNNITLNVVGDGAAAMDYIQQAGMYGSHLMPDLILLDLNLPKLNGLDVLERIKKHEQWRSIPIVVLTMSESERDIAESYSMHVNCYITKPLDFGSFVDVVQQIEDFWLSIVRLPGMVAAQ
jgi:chemotaxis family two-component system response regulator Rcp1